MASAELALEDADLARLLTDDVPHGDLTTRALGIGARRGRLDFLARGAMRVCGSEEAARLFALAGAEATVVAASGTDLPAGGRLLEARGSAAALHRAWKTAQVLIEATSGIASAAAELVAAVAIPVACTRKSMPGTKALSIKAVRSGGACMHRHGLSDTLLVFPEHRLFLDEAPAQTVKRLQRSEPERRIVVEVATVEAALEWARAGAEILQLEKFSLEALALCRALVDALPAPRPLLAAAGGVRADNAAHYAQAGADLLVTSWPFFAAPRDVQVNFAAC